MFKKTASIALVAAVAAAFMFASVGVSEAKGKKKKMAAPAKSPICMQASAPVCATRGGMKFTYANACFAANDGATKIKASACKPPKKVKKAKKAKAKKAAAAPAAKPATAAAPAAKPAATTGAAAPANAKK
jgi:hypothetical protein